MRQSFGQLNFLPADLSAHAEFCMRFRVDSFIASFGSAERFYQESGYQGEKYLESLRAKLESDPPSAVHVWEGEQIIGQMELGRFRPDPSIGYVNLYYLIEDKRGCGYSRFLDEYASEYLRLRGYRKARLSVSPTNIRAMRYYARMSWADLGPRPGHPDVHLMEKEFALAGHRAP